MEKGDEACISEMKRRAAGRKKQSLIREQRLISEGSKNRKKSMSEMMKRRSTERKKEARLRGESKKRW